MRKTKKKARKKGQKRSSARRGQKTMKLQVHVGVDFPYYMQARSFALKAQKALKSKKMPEIRKVEGKKGKIYAVVLPHDKVDKRKLAAMSKKTKK